MRPVVAVLGVLAAGALSPRVESAQDLSARTVLAAADRYLRDYQQQLVYVLADEWTTQQVADGSGRVTARRLTRGDLFMTYVPGDRMWVAVHDTAIVDGQPVDGREDLRQLLQRAPAAGVARQLIASNARFNLGSVERNFNEPTLGLQLLATTRRSQISFDLRDAPRGAELVTLAFRETDRPTLIRARDRQLFSRGEVTLEPATGRIRRTFVQVPYDAIVAELTTIYAHDAGLDLWVPSTFIERYERTSPARSRELISCVTTYTNWRRFAVTSSFRPD